MWRYLIGIIFLALTACAPPKPVSWQPPSKEFHGAKGIANFEINTPKGNFHGQAIVLVGGNFVYFEVPSPFGLTLYQGILYQNHAEIIDFTRREVYFLKFSFPPEIYSYWGNIFLGFFPDKWSQYAVAYQKDRGFLIEVSFPNNQKVLAHFTTEGNLLSLEIKGSRATLKFKYHEKNTQIVVSRLRTKANFSFQELSLLASPPKIPDLYSPQGFRVLFYDLKRL